MRAQKGTVSPFPKWAIDEIGGVSFPLLVHSHSFGKDVPLSFPKGFKWGYGYVVKARFRAAEPHHKPGVMDLGSSKSVYVVEEVVLETAVDLGACFSLNGEVDFRIKRNLTTKKLLELFHPNIAKFKNGSDLSKFEKFLKDDKSRWFSVQACFDQGLEIILDKIRYDQ